MVADGGMPGRAGETGLKRCDEFRVDVPKPTTRSGRSRGDGTPKRGGKSHRAGRHQEFSTGDEPDEPDQKQKDVRHVFGPKAAGVTWPRPQSLPTQGAFDAR